MKINIFCHPSDARYAKLLAGNYAYDFGSFAPTIESAVSIFVCPFMNPDIVHVCIYIYESKAKWYQFLSPYKLYTDPSEKLGDKA